MRIIHDVEEWRFIAAEQRALGHTVGLVPTMGALHAGHTSMFDAAKAHGDVVIATLFVNPRQFESTSDLARYPRTLDADRAAAELHAVDYLVEPTLAAMWPSFPAATPTTVTVGGVGESLEGAARPGHFDGVASVVAKLFTVTGPCRAYFGEKDFQQLAVIRQMVRDLSFAVDVVACEIVRDEDGLALSSRNVQLSPDARRRALVLSRALVEASQSPATASEHRRRLRATLASADVDVIYAEVVDRDTFIPSDDLQTGEARALVAALVDGVRLIDNGPVQLQGGR
jgi:pantoate--beta-alanine ligase